VSGGNNNFLSLKAKEKFDDLIGTIDLGEFLFRLGIRLIVVGMVLLGEVPEHPLNRVLVRVRTDLQELVVVDEWAGIQGGAPSGLSIGLDGPEL